MRGMAANVFGIRIIRCVSIGCGVGDLEKRTFVLKLFKSTNVLITKI
jgi:hypothetical protein